MWKVVVNLEAELSTGFSPATSTLRIDPWQAAMTTNRPSALSAGSDEDHAEHIAHRVGAGHFEIISCVNDCITHRNVRNPHTLK